MPVYCKASEISCTNSTKNTPDAGALDERRCSFKTVKALECSKFHSIRTKDGKEISKGPKHTTTSTTISVKMRTAE